MNEVNQAIENNNAELVRNIARTITSKSKRDASLYSSASKIVEQITGNNQKSTRLVTATFNGIKSRIDIKDEFTKKAWDGFRSMFLRQCKKAGYIVKVTQKDGIYEKAVISLVITEKADDVDDDELSNSPDTGRADNTPKNAHGLEPALDKIAAIMAAYEVEPAQVVKRLIEDMQTPAAAQLMLELGFVRLMAGVKSA